MAAVYAHRRFTYINVGRPGSVGDATAYNHSKLKHDIMSGRYLSQKNSKVIECEDESSQRINPYLIVDTAFPFRTEIMKNWDGSRAKANLAERYHRRHKGTCVVVENACGILKSC